MHESPRIRRLRSDLGAMERLVSESSVMRFRASGKPVQHYLIEFRGKSLARVRGRVAIADRHEVEIKLGASYPRTMPELRWLSPIYHPNISEIGMVCLGGYGTHWVPSLNLDELCGMLWDMARYHNYDVRSPYNREAALWVANQTSFVFPVDSRPLRDLRAALGRVEPPDHPHPHPHTALTPAYPELEVARPPAKPGEPGSRAGKYAQFVRTFSEGLNGLSPTGTLQSGHASQPEPMTDGADGLLILDEDDAPIETREEHQAPPPLPPPPRLRTADEEILFIE